jgi:glutathione S-transferase
MATFPPLTFYRINSACSLVPYILLHQLNAPFIEAALAFDFQTKSLAPQDSSMTHAQYLATVHPDGMVPAICINDTVITEMTAIFTYITALAEQHGKQ